MSSTSSWDRIPDSIRHEIGHVRDHRVLYVLGVAISALHFWLNSFGNIAAQSLNVIHYGSLVLCRRARGFVTLG